MVYLAWATCKHSFNLNIILLHVSPLHKCSLTLVIYVGFISCNRMSGSHYKKSSLIKNGTKFCVWSVSCQCWVNVCTLMTRPLPGHLVSWWVWYIALWCVVKWLASTHKFSTGSVLQIWILQCCFGQNVTH